MAHSASTHVPVLKSLAARSFVLALVFTSVGVAALAMIPENAPTWLLPILEALCIMGTVGVLYFVAIRPYRSLQEAISALRSGDYALEVSTARRSDEIGAAARDLQGMAQELAAAATQMEEAAFKGAAFNGSSAAMMLLDQDFKILHMNPALEALMVEYRAAFVSDVPGFDHKKIVGGSMDMFHARRPQVRKILSDPKNLPYKGQVKLGEERLTIEVAWVADAAGKHLGYVAEWKRVTDEQRKEALIGALDSAQLRIEMDPAGAVVDANAAALSLLDRSAETARGLEFLSRVRNAGAPVADRLRAGEAIIGLLEIEVPGGTTRLLDGVLAPARDFAGRLMMSVIVARDVTEDHKAANARAAREDRARREQAHVVETLGTALGDLAKGTLSCPIEEEFPAEYESLRRDFNAASTTLGRAVTLVIENAEAIRNEANEITSASTDLNRRTEQQAATLEETAAALDELTASVQSAAAVAEAARKMVESTQERAKRSGKVVRDTVNAMQEIAASSTQISKITSVIDEIAFQTNLLALNAGVEAARAGEAGRGFAVVASEVRALAQRSSDAAREIAQLIDTSTTQVRRGVDLVDEAGVAITEIETRVSEIREQIVGMATSSTEQATGIKEINVAVNQLDQVTQQNAAISEETNAATQSLLAMSGELLQSTAQFEVRGGTPATARTATPPAQPAFGSRRAAEPKRAVAGSGAATAADTWEEF